MPDELGSGLLTGLADGGVFRPIPHIHIPRRGLDRGDHQFAGNRRLRARVLPFMDFRVAIGKTNAAGAIVVTGRNIDDHNARRGAAVIHGHGEIAVINAVRMLVD